MLVLLSSGAGHAQAPCEPPAARVVSVQGTVELKRSGTDVWTPAMLEEALCIGDALRVGEASRAALALANDSTLRLDQRTTLQLRGLAEEERSLLELLFGAVYFFSHRPRALEIDTPFINAAAEGTEFLVRVGADRAEVVMLGGQVLLQNPHGELRIASGDAAVVPEGEAPQPMIVVRPRDAVAWALYYPPILAELAAPGARPRPVPPGLRAAIERVADNDYAGALEALETVPEAARDARYYTYLAGVLLNVGRVEEAEEAIERALALDPEAGEALAQRAIIHVVQSRKADALTDARRAVELSPESSAARIALSYALQAAFQLEDARAALREAVERNPEDALAWARLAELEQMFGELGASRDAAEQAVALAPALSRTHMVLGFAALTRIDIDEAKTAFERAIALDSANPLPRLGLGLARIRQSDLEEGRQEIEIAAALDPNDALIRSYLGKAYFEEKRDPLAGEQYAIAKQLDPNDPTPWFYDAIRLQLNNRPVDALRSLERSIELNDNRAPFRSRLLLDEDRATRGIGLARIYDDLGFEQLGVNEATKSLSVDPANHSAHRFLADVYADAPRQQIARVSELLQSQLLQPVSINPVQPSLPFTDLNVVAGTRLAPAFNEFTPMFERNRAQLTATGLVGNNDTLGDEVVVSALYNRFAASAGQFHSETDGFRDNNDAENDIYDLFAQAALTPKVNVQAEYRHRETQEGDLVLDFDPEIFFDTDRRNLDQDTLRVGVRWSPSPGLDIVASGVHSSRDEKTVILDPEPDFNFERDSETDGYNGELQLRFRMGQFTSVAGTGAYVFDVDSQSGFVSEAPFQTKFSGQHVDGYMYHNVRWPKDVIWTLGFSADSFEEDTYEVDKFNPKFGLRWDISDDVALRLAALSVVKRALLFDQTIEPTQIAGFNQFFDEVNGTKSDRYAIGLDFDLTGNLRIGAEASHREIEDPTFVDSDIFIENENENIVRGYAYWTPHERVAVSAEFISDWFKRGEEVIDIDRPRPIKVDTVKFPLEIRYFSPAGWFGGVKGTMVHQDLKRSVILEDEITGGLFADPRRDDSSFFVVDVVAGYRLPKRAGLASIEIKNVFDDDFNLLDDNFRTSEQGAVRNSDLIPDRTILARLTLTF